MLVDTPLLVVGKGPAALVVAKVAAAYGLACLLVGHEPTGGDVAVLDAWRCSAPSRSTACSTSWALPESVDH